jgi:hypothetical protein
MGKHNAPEDGKLRMSAHRGEHRADEPREQQERNRVLNEIRSNVRGGGYIPPLPGNKSE